MSEQFLVQIEDERMTPDLYPSDICVVDRHLKPKDGELVCAQRNDGGGCLGWYKTVGMDARGRALFELVASNKSYPPYRKRPRDGVRITGVVVEVRRRVRPISSNS